MAILSIQSHVAYGHVGNAAAAFPLQRLGREVWQVHTVMFSNHAGYGGFRGPVFSPETVSDVVEGIEERGVMDCCSAVLSGYMGDVALGDSILDAADRVKRHNPDALYCCDPVMGDDGRGVYVRRGIPDFMREKAVPAADIVTPNRFELELLSGRPVAGLEDAADAARMLGPSIVLVTSLKREDRAPGTIEMLAVERDGPAWLVATPELVLDPAPNGSGDATAALFLAFYLENRDVGRALERTAAAIFAVFDATREAGTRELALIQAQDAIADPPRRFPVTRID